MELKGIFYNPNFGLWAQGVDKHYYFGIDGFKSGYVYRRKSSLEDEIKDYDEVKLGPSNLVEWDE
jgi:hypothetical protein